MNTLLNMNRLLDDFFVDSYQPMARLYWDEHENHYEVQLNLAGFKKDKIKVTIDNNILKVSASQERKEYSRSLLMPEESTPAGSSVSYEDGLLTIKINKKESAKTIELKIK